MAEEFKRMEAGWNEGEGSKKEGQEQKEGKKGRRRKMKRSRLNQSINQSSLRLFEKKPLLRDAGGVYNRIKKYKN